MASDIGSCLACGTAGWGQNCGTCGGLMVFGPLEGTDESSGPFQPGESQWMSETASRRYENCTVHGLEATRTKAEFLVEDGGISIWQRGSVVASWTASEVTAIEVDDAAGVRSRITATRVVLFGGLGFLAPKRTVTSFVTVTTTAETFVVEVPDVSPPALRAELHRLWPPSSAGSFDGAPTEGSVPSVEERIRALARLHDDGLVDDDEFAAKRAHLLDLL